MLLQVSERVVRYKYCGFMHCCIMIVISEKGIGPKMITSEPIICALTALSISLGPSVGNAFHRTSKLTSLIAE